MNNLTLAVLLFLLGQTLIWFQANGQFKWEWFNNNILLISIVGGTIISYAFILATKYAYEYFDGLLWPGRFLGFALGISSYAILTWWIMGEGINLKTMTSLILSIGIICVQLFWKVS
jgi:Kef-type K+ transport system membrane component KefB